MKKLLFILLTLFTLQSFAQDTSYVKVRNGIPGVYNLTKNGDSLVFYVSGERFALSVGSVVDLTPFLRKADTASMLLPYATKSKVQADSMTLAAAISGYTTLSKYKTDSTSFQNQINSKQPAGTYVVPADIDEVFVNSEFDTSSRSLTLTRKDGTSQSVVIPRGTASGVSGIADLSKSRTGDLVTISGDNGSTISFSINNSDSATRTHLSDTSNLIGTKSDLNNKVDKTTTINGHALSSNVTISASDLTTGTLPHAQLPTLLAGDIPSLDWSKITTGKPTIPTATSQLTNDAGFITSADVAGKVDKTTTVNGKALSTNITLAKSDVGLGNVDNTSDISKPISTAVQTALNGKLNISDTAGKWLSPGTAGITYATKATTLAGYGITDAVTTTGTQTILGAKTFTSSSNAFTIGTATFTPNTGGGLSFIDTTSSNNRAFNFFAASPSILQYDIRPLAAEGAGAAGSFSKGGLGINYYNKTQLWDNGYLGVVRSANSTLTYLYFGAGSDASFSNNNLRLYPDKTVGLMTVNDAVGDFVTRNASTGAITRRTASEVLADIGALSTTGNAASATKLQTAVNINGVPFNGTGPIIITDATKEPIITAGTTAQYWRGDKTWQTLNPAAVGAEPAFTKGTAFNKNFNRGVAGTVTDGKEFTDSLAALNNRKIDTSYRDVWTVNYPLQSDTVNKKLLVAQSYLDSLAAKTNPTFTGTIKVNTDTVATQAYARSFSGSGGGGSLPDLSSKDYPDDSTAYANGIKQWGWYRTGNIAKILVTVPDTTSFTVNKFNYVVSSTGGNAYQSLRFNGWNGNFNVSVDWGDGTTTSRAGDSSDYHIYHTYTGAGTWRPVFTFSDSTKVLQVHLSRLDSVTAINKSTYFSKTTEYDIAFTKMSSLNDFVYPSTVTVISINDNYNLTSFNPSTPLPAGLQSLSVSGNNNKPNGSGILAPITGLTYPLPATITSIDFGINNWTQAQVNAVLVYLDGLTFNAGAKTLNIKQYIAGSTPSGAGLTAKSSLQSKGWTVTTD